MRIISQDKMKHIEYVFLKITAPEEWLGDNAIHAKSWSIVTLTTNISLGTYSTKEKASKVLDMIWQPRYWASSNALIKDGDFVPGFERYVFYMPKDEEVYNEDN